MSRDRDSFIKAFCALFPVPVTTAVKSWRALQDVPAPHIEEFLVAMTTAAAAKRSTQAATAAAIAGAIGRPEGRP